MRKILFICFLTLLYFTNLLAQDALLVQKHADSLLKAIEKQPHVDEKIHGYLDLSFFMSDFDISKSLEYIRKAESLMPSPGNNYYKGLLAFYKASAYFDADREKSKACYLKAETFFKNTKDKRALRYRIRLWASYGALLQRDGNQQQYAEALLNKSIPLAKQIGDTLLMASNYQNVGMVFMNQHQYEKAESYYQQALHLLGSQYQEKEERLTTLVNYARNSLFANKLSLARKMLDSAALMVPNRPLSPYLPMYYSVEGTYWQKKNNVPQALSYFEKGLQTAIYSGNKYLEYYILYEQFELYKRGKNWQAAKSVLKRVLQHVEAANSLLDKQTVYYNLAFAENQLGNYKAANGWYERFKLVTDSLTDKNVNAHVLELEKKYQTAAKDKELLQLKNDKQQQELIIQRNRILVVILAGLALIALLSVWTVRKNYRQKKLLIEQQEKILLEERKSLKQEEQLKLFNAMVQGQERERNRIARDLHDGLGGMLASVKLKLSSLASQEEKKMVKHDHYGMELYQIIDQLDHSANELRRIARNMMPESLLYMGLEPALKDLCQSFDTVERRVKFEGINLRDHYDQSFLIAVYRIVQELLANAAKHAQASQIVVQCSEHENHFYITVEDDGKGFNKENISGNGIGLSNIKTRVDLLGGSIEIDTAEGQGSTFNIDIKLYG